jgi:hypothetical protein
MYKRDGELLWERKFIAVGKNFGSSGKDVILDTKVNFYHMRLTGANIFGPLIGENDIYLVKLGLDNIYECWIVNLLSLIMLLKTKKNLS